MSGTATPAARIWRVGLAALVLAVVGTAVTLAGAPALGAGFYASPPLPGASVLIVVGLSMLAVTCATAVWGIARGGRGRVLAIAALIVSVDAVAVALVPLVLSAGLER